MSIKIIKAFNQKPIVIYPVYVQLTGDYAAAAALGQIIYWHDVMKGTFYKTDADFEQELLLTVDKFKRVKNILKKLSFLKIKAKGNPAKTFYDVDYDALTLVINSLGENPQTRLGENPQTRLGENPQTRLGENPQTLYTENKQKLSETTTTEIVAAAAVVLDELEMKVFAWASAHSYWSQFTVTKETFLKTLHKPSGAMMAQYEMAIANQSKIVIDRKFIEKHAKTHETYSQAENRLKEKFANGCQHEAEVTVIQEKNKRDVEKINLRNTITQLEGLNKLSPNPELVTQIMKLKQQLEEFKMKS